MGWRVVGIANPARLSVKNSALIVENDEGRASIPIEDISALVLETRQALISSYLMAELGKSGVAVYFCDEKHLPCASLVPYCTHSRPLAALKMQLETSVPFRKNCWRRVIEAKIANQARCLEILGYPDFRELDALAAEVRSGDATNREAVAARFYFRNILRSGKRGGEDAMNAALDYGYAIVRGVITRSIAEHGFIPFLGVHHCNELNPFNLADDFIEPFRPLVDLWVSQNVDDKTVFNLEIRKGLAALLVCLMVVDGERLTVIRAVETLVSSFVGACREKSPDRLKLPGLVPIVKHTEG